MNVLHINDNFNFQCEICSKNFSNDLNNPILLKCGHTICNSCFNSPMQEVDSKIKQNNLNSDRNSENDSCLSENDLVNSTIISNNFNRL